VAELDSDALAIVEQCLDVPAGVTRDACVQRLTEGRPALRDRVEELLSHADDAFGALSTQAFAAANVAPLPMPDRVGAFRITALIAEGGMGSVVRAERDDGVYVQTVAIKLIRGDLSTADAETRFAEERRILARLDHPGIARVVDGGSEEGRPWLAMEFVDGEPITSALDASGADRERRLAAFLDTCEAIAFAHRALVVHADIKPANVLLRADGVVKLLDFGIARLIEEIEPVEASAPYPLTLVYAAPERTQGGAPTVAGDIYSLGVLLGELIEGQRHDADLDAIVARARAAAPADRYPDVPTLVADLRAYLAHFPVAARSSVGPAYRAGKFLRRHRLGALITTAIILLLGAAAITSTTLYIRAEQARVEAERRFMEVRALSRFMLFELYDELADSPGTLPSRLRLAETARRYLEQLQRVPDAPVDLQLDIARGWRRLAAVEGLSGGSSFGQPDRARRSLDRAEAQVRAILAANPADAGALSEAGWVTLGRWTLLGNGPDSDATTRRAAGLFTAALRRHPGLAEARLGLLTARRNRGYDLLWANQPSTAATVLQAALTDLRRERFGGQLGRDARTLEATMLSRIGDAVYYSGDVAGALTWYREQDALIRAQLAHRPSLVWTDKLGEAKFNLSGTLMELPGRRDEALAEARGGIAALERALSFGPDLNLERRLSILYGQGALVLDDLGRHDEAAALSRLGFSLRTARLARTPGDPQHLRDVGVAGANHARILAEAGAREEACAAAQAAEQAWEAIRRAGDLGARDAENELAPVAAAARSYCR
jgi:tetratricopeptide (TPR) repeat protein